MCGNGVAVFIARILTLSMTDARMFLKQESMYCAEDHGLTTNLVSCGARSVTGSTLVAGSTSSGFVSPGVLSCSTLFPDLCFLFPVLPGSERAAARSDAREFLKRRL